MSDVSSPCVRNCCLDEREVCLGCGRSLDEIKAWSEASDGARLAILDQAARRRAEREARMQAWREGREQV
jgi:hypothetical protein